MRAAHRAIAEALALPVEDVAAVHEALVAAGYASRKRGAMPLQTVALIRRLGREGMNARQIGELVGYSRSACDSVLRGATHRPVTGGRHARHG
ncbi:hypothetical protein SAMN05878426_1088 [Phaeovulum vinaykumarii]|uniref:Uncharacterized protein n=1 Tax=Phaeovulum vinaykumarii TaxID=407234 RepID=A0A1N7MNJ1_9RHOB|nr:hypothetical protein SAMN05421795_108138 [Phaeovulum vinaykumarii]SOC12990.1 hypothetical protein SAMN05878426_1088 [Phaeovulum vinaykumarii]